MASPTLSTTIQSLFNVGRDLTTSLFGILTYSILTTCLGIAITYILLNSVYNRYLHPLRRFPGPFWGSVTEFYKLWLFATKESHTIEYDLHKKYGTIASLSSWLNKKKLDSEMRLGPVVRIAPNLIVFDDPRLLSKIYHRNADKSDFYHTSILGNTRSAFQIIGAKDHLVRRKLLAPSVSQVHCAR